MYSTSQSCDLRQTLFTRGVTVSISHVHVVTPDCMHWFEYPGAGCCLLIQQYTLKKSCKCDGKNTLSHLGQTCYDNPFTSFKE